MNNDTNGILVVLPDRIPILTTCKHSAAGMGRKIEEYSLYFSNFIYPYFSDLEIQVHCAYGHNYGDCWRLETDSESISGGLPDDVTEFPLSIVVYDAYGKKLAEKHCIMELYSDEKDLPEFRVLPIGDSMTHSQRYLEHVAEKLPKVAFVGTRSFNGWLAHEGRGGFASEDYVYKFQDPYAPSPFVFPKGVEGKNYFGDYTFHWQMRNNWRSHPYVYCGYELQELKDGMIYNREGKLYRQVDGNEVLFCEKPQWEFHFSKYMDRNQLGDVDAVSILIGTNDVLKLHYDTMEQGIDRLVENVQTMIDSIRTYSEDLPIILNAPILATSDSVAFGRCYGCDKHPKESRAIMLRYIERLLEKWDKCEDQNLYIVPMNAVLDPIRGFPRRGYSMGRYFDEPEIHVEDAIHPNKGGYSQMGDALAAMIQKIRMKKYEEN